MSPQPLSKVRSGASIRSSEAGDIIRYRPELTIMVMSVIEVWARIDAQLTKMLSAFLKADFLVVSAMVQALTGAEGKRAALMGVAAQALSGDDIKLFNAVMKVISPSRNRRNDFAHHIWGISPDLEDALLLMDPKHLVRDDAALRDHFVQSLKSYPTHPPLEGSAMGKSDYSNIFVYKTGDLAEDLKFAKECLGYVLILSWILRAGAEGDPIRRQLSLEPPIRQALQQMTNGSAQAVPPSMPTQSPIE